MRAVAFRNEEWRFVHEREHQQPTDSAAGPGPTPGGDRLGAVPDHEQGAYNPLLDGKTTEAEKQAIRPVLAQSDDDLLARTEQEARAGARVVVWPESGAAVFQEDKAAFLQKARTVAQTSGIYLDMGLAVVLPPSDKPPTAQDTAVLIDPAGNVVWTYQKAHPIPGDEDARLVPGDGQLPFVATPCGRLTTIICFDTDIPSSVLQVGRGNADVLLRPSGDWQEIDPLHTQMATFHAIENGVSLVTQADLALSTAVDYEGNVLAASDYFTSDPQVMVAYVPTHGVRTIYATIGDAFAWLSIAGLVALVGRAVVRRRTAEEPGTPKPLGEPLRAG